MVEEDSTNKKRISRRRLLKRAAVAAGGAGFVYCAGTSRLLRVRRLKVLLPRLPVAMHGFKIAFAADFHLGRHFPIQKVKAAVDAISALEADLVLLGGDYITHSSGDFGASIGEISRLAAPHGVWAVPGNHDRWSGVRDFAGALAGSSVSDLTNRGVAVGDPQTPIWVAGLEDLWTGYPKIDQALSGAPEGAPRIILCHNPYTVHELPPGTADVILAGHTHGWQVYVPLVTWALIPANLSRYRRGFYRTPAGLMYVTSGVGMISPPIRWWCRPEIVLIELEAPRR